MRRLKAFWVTAPLSLAAFPLDHSIAASAGRKIDGAPYAIMSNKFYLVLNYAF